MYREDRSAYVVKKASREEPDLSMRDKSKRLMNKKRISIYNEVPEAESETER